MGFKLKFFAETFPPSGESNPERQSSLILQIGDAVYPICFRASTVNDTPRATKSNVSAPQSP